MDIHTDASSIPSSFGDLEHHMSRVKKEQRDKAKSIFKRLIPNDKLRDKLHLYLCILTATVIGNCARMGITDLSSYELAFMQPITVLWANCTSNIAMGFMQAMLAEPGFMEEHMILFMTITTGFCGAYSSFSGMVVSIFEHSTSLTTFEVKNEKQLPNPGYGVMAFLSVTMAHMFMCMSGLLFGRKLATDIIIRYFSVEYVVPEGFEGDITSCDIFDSESDHTIEENMHNDEGKQVTLCKKPCPGLRWLFLAIDHTMAALGIPLAIILVVLASYYDNYSRAKWTLPSLFGFFGAFLRYGLSTNLNSVFKWFPLGTFIANVGATLLTAILAIINRGRRAPHSDLPIANTVHKCRIVYALIEGFCATLSTVSAFIHEGYVMSFFHMLSYYGISIGASYISCVVTLGAFAWRRGLVDPLCPN